MIRRLLLTVVPACLMAALAAAPAPAAPAYVPSKVIVGLRPLAPPTVVAQVARADAPAGAPAPTPQERVVTLRRGESVPAAIRTLRRRGGVAYAVPDYIAHAAGAFYPDDPGRSGRRGGWAAMQWNFLPFVGVNAPGAWANLIAAHRPGGRGVIVAVLDTGVAFRNWRIFHRAPDFAGTRFVAPYDFVAGNRYPLDRDGHGTFVAGVIAETSNNGYGLTGLAYGASIMPVRILGADGTGDAATIARGIRYAVAHHAQVINLSLVFNLDVTPSDIPEILSAIRVAHDHGVTVVAAAGNDGVAQIAYPARAPQVISVGATTRDRCLADYSNDGSHLDLVAPGGNNDTSMLTDPNCRPARNLPDISQMTFFDPSNPNHFGYPGGWYGTSMAAPHVAAAAALVIASGVIGSRPKPEAVLVRLEQTAQQLGTGHPNQYYGYGLVDAAAATTEPATAARRRR